MEEETSQIHKVHQLLKQVPIVKDFNNILTLNLESNRIKSLNHIERYTQLTNVNLSHNYIQSVLEFAKVPQPNRLKHLEIAGNPFCEKVNYLFDLLMLFENLLCLKYRKDREQIYLTPALRNTLIKSQQTAGHYLVSLLSIKLETIALMEQPQQTQESLHSIETSQGVVHQLLRSLEQCEETLNESPSKFYLINYTFQHCVDLLKDQTNIETGNINLNQQIYIKYYLSNIISLSSLSSNNFINYFLTKLDLQNEQLNCLRNDVHLLTQKIAFIILQDYQKSLNYCKSQTKAFKSVDTVETTQRNKEDAHIYPYFCLDEEFMTLILQIVKKQYSLLFEKMNLFRETVIAKLEIDEQLMRCRQDSLELCQPTIQEGFEEEDDEKDEIDSLDQMEKPNIMKTVVSFDINMNQYTIKDNPIFWRSLINIFDKVILSIIFRRIRHCKRINPAVTQYMAKAIFKVLQRHGGVENAFNNLRSYTSAVNEFQLAVSSRLIKSAFEKWKSLKKKHQKLIKRILTRKANIQAKLLSHFLMRWRLQTRRFTFAKVLKKDQKKFDSQLASLPSTLKIRSQGTLQKVRSVCHFQKEFAYTGK